MSDFSVLSSHWEGFGLAAAESMACGIPTIASDVDGLAQVVKGGGLLFEKGNENDLKDKIQMLASRDQYVLYVKSGADKAEKYNIDNMVRKQKELYKTL
jgi:glycosyltransferase involved in cell wall biosynthesis